MANLRGILRSESGTGRSSEVSRLANSVIRASLNTWKTVVNVSLNKDGRVLVSVTRDGNLVLDKVVDPEGPSGRFEG